MVKDFYYYSHELEYYAHTRCIYKDLLSLEPMTNFNLVIIVTNSVEQEVCFICKECNFPLPVKCVTNPIEQRIMRMSSCAKLPGYTYR